MRVTRWMAAVAMGLIMLTGCSQTPAQHDERLRKAAGVTAFRITCTKDMWERTRQTTTSTVEGKVTPTSKAGVVTVELTGPQLVDYLTKLKHLAFPNLGGSGDPLARRMYDALAPQVDKIRPGSAGGPVPQIVLDDVVAPTTAPSPSPKASSS
ncbi:hypothetical protein [Streptosporangium roseum]|uniref:hypothetical protein n=1 Tax=Streptosporangium roseum TaxID=2001 RepID=UPI0004CD0515|nr:hypothetical protein [Streptosporangium roseum]